MAFAWTTTFPRWLDESWANASLESLALKYDTVEHHGWYDNLDLTVDQMKAEAMFLDGLCAAPYAMEFDLS